MHTIHLEHDATVFFSFWTSLGITDCIASHRYFYHYYIAFLDGMEGAGGGVCIFTRAVRRVGMGWAGGMHLRTGGVWVWLLLLCV